MINNLRKFLKTHWQAKIVSVIIAILFSYYVEYSKTIKKVFYIKVQPPSIPNYLIISEEIPAFMKVVFYGPEEIINIEQTSFTLLLINTGPGPGKNKFSLELMPPPPAGIQAIIEPPEIEILLDNKKKKTLPLIPNFTLPQPEKKIVYWNFNPVSLTVEGPEKIFTKLDRIYTRKINLSKNSNIFFDKILIDKLPNFVKLVENQPFEIPIEVKYLSNEEIQEKINSLPSEYKVYEEELDAQCNELPETLEIVNPQKVKISYISKYVLNKNFFRLEIFCPVEYNPNMQTIEPSANLSDLPVQIRVSQELKNIEILKIDPLLVSFQFQVKRKPVINQKEKALQEHLIQ